MTSPSYWQSPHGRALPTPGGRTLLMGVLNLTPDSFSDGGELPSLQAVVDRAGAMLVAGADILDLGGESTRPEAAPISAAEEMERVLPAIKAVREAFSSAPLSIDTYKAEVARAAVAAGADVVNDVWGGLHGFSAARRRELIASLHHPTASTQLAVDESPLAAVVADLGCPLILMHNRPDRDYKDFWPEVLDDLRLSVLVARSAGIAHHQLWLDPGFGFAKEPAQNLEVLRHLARVVELGFPVLLGTSRKSTLGRVLDAPVEDRLDATGATLVWGIQQGCQMVRVHDVAPMRRFVKMADALRAGLAWTP